MELSKSHARAVGKAQDLESRGYSFESQATEVKVILLFLSSAKRKIDF